MTGPLESARAVVLLSGGMDSAVVLAMAKQLGFSVHALTFDYGQRHRTELAAAQQQALLQKVTRHIVFPLDLSALAVSALTRDIPIPPHDRERNPNDAIPATYVPARNTVFLSIALSLAESIGAHDIFIGVSAVDYSGYPDCRPAFVDAFTRVANLGTRAADGGPQVTVHAPLLHLTKEETVRRGIALGVDFDRTHTCYDPDAQGHACGGCDACVLRKRGFDAAGVPDPACLIIGSKG